jgi:hypothetical protein
MEISGVAAASDDAANAVFRGRLSDVLAVAGFYKTAIRNAGYNFPSRFVDSLILTERGKELVEFLILEGQGYSKEFATAIVGLEVFQGNDALVDIDRTNIEELIASLSAEIINGKLTFPWIFDRLLYDRTFTMFPDHDKTISIEDTERLLADTPVGVFQLGSIIVGPLGALRSTTSRSLGPVSELLLSHCADPACNALHISTISQSDKTVPEALRLAKKFLQQGETKTSVGEQGQHFPFDSAADWYSSHRQADWYNDFSLINLPLYVGDAFSHREVQTIAERLIARHKEDIRGQLPSKSSKRFLASASDIAKGLTKPEALQTILIADDQKIYAAIDTLIFDRIIIVPPSEIRTHTAAPQIELAMSAFLQCSNLGLRVVSGQTSQALGRLKRLALELYPEEDRKDLAWKLSRKSGLGDDQIKQTLEGQITTRPPNELLQVLAFGSGEKLQRAFDLICAPHLVLPSDPAEDDLVMQRILWKLGFRRGWFESDLMNLYALIDDLRLVAETNYQVAEQWKSRIRGVGANLFPLVEDLLDRSLAFSTWMLLADIYDEQLVFDVRRARQRMATVLSTVVSTEEGPIVIDPHATNTLFPLIMGFVALRQKSTDLLTQRHQYVRPSEMHAHFSGEQTFYSFPFRHWVYLFDAPSDCLTCVLETIGKVVAELQSPQVLQTRNGVVHPKKVFPTASEIVRCCGALRTTFSLLESTGLFPVVYATEAVERDSYGRSRITSVDYGGKKQAWYRSPALNWLDYLPSVYAPQILVPAMRFSETNEIFRVSMQEDSEYSEMWQNYPRRHKPEGLSSEPPSLN